MSASRVTRPVSSDDATPFKFFGSSPSRIAAGGLISPGARDRVLDSGDGRSPRAAHDDKLGIAAPVQRGLHLADPFLERNQLRFRLPEGLRQQGVLDGEA